MQFIEEKLFLTKLLPECNKQEVCQWPSWILPRIKVLFKIRGFNLGASKKIK